MSAELDSLVSLITTQVQEIQAICASKKMPLTSIDEPDATPGPTMDPSVVHAANIAIAAAKRLIATLNNPFRSTYTIAAGASLISLLHASLAYKSQMCGSALLNVVVEANITEALKEAGPEGMHVRELASKVGMDPSKLGRVLRHLCAMHHMYREVSPDVFTNNRLSMALDTGKTFDEVKDRDAQRYTGSKGTAAYVGHITDIVLKGAGLLSEVLLDPETGFSTDPRKTAAMKAVEFDGTIYEWFEQPAQSRRLNRFGEAMKNLHLFLPQERSLSVYPWPSIPDGGVVVDVGGGLGSSTLPLARTHPNLKFVVQDRAPVIAEAEKHWALVYPEAINSGLVRLQAHDFFDPQPIKGAAVHILRHILHNWDDSKAIKILEQLRPALAPGSKVIIIEHIVPYTCPVEDKSITGEIPEVLRGNLAPYGGFSYISDIMMLNIFNAQERTIVEWERLVKSAGLKIDFIHPGHIYGIVCSLI